MSELTQAQREAMARAFEEEHGAGFVASSLMSPVIAQEFQAGFLAGLRYQDEPEAAVEAAAKALWNLYHPSKDWALQTREQQDVMCEKAEIILNAAREAKT